MTILLIIPFRSESKKMRQDSESGSSSDVDAEAVAKRKNEALIDKAPKGAATDDVGKSDKRRKSESSDSETEAKKVEKKKPKPKPASAKKPKPGPKTKKAAEAPVKEADMFTTEAVQYCDDCDAIFLSMEALKSHRNTKHAYDGGPRIGGGSDSDSSSAESVSEVKGKGAKKTPAQIKKERRESRLVSSSSEKDDSSGDEDGPTKPGSVKKKPGKPPKSAFSAKKDKEGPAKKPRGSSSVPEGSGRQCLRCPKIEKDKGAMKNHIINHYKDQMFLLLPTAKPFECPDCEKPNRDKITLVRHWAYTHKHIYEYSNDDEIAGKYVDGDSIGASAKSNGSAPKSSKKQPMPRIVDSSSSDSDDGGGASKKRKSVEREIPPEEAAKKSSEPPPTNVTTTIKFSDDSDDDFASATSATANASKSFDDLLKDDKPGDDKEVRKEAEKDGEDVP